MFSRNHKFVRDVAFFIILFQLIIGIGVAAYQFTGSPNDTDEIRTDNNLIFDPKTADYVDVNTSDVDGGGSQGSHSNFPDMQATDTIYDTLKENEAITPPIECFVDNTSSDVDASANLGFHSNFSALQYGPDSTYDNITEINTAGTVNTTFINAESFEGTWPPPSGWSETGNWDKEPPPQPPPDGSYSADFDGFGGGGGGISGYLTTPSIDCSDASTIYVEFYWYDYNLDDDDFELEYYDGSAWDNYQDLNQLESTNGWHHYTAEITDNQYFVSNFQIRWWANSVSTGESAHVDVVTVKKETPILPENYELNLEVQFTDVPDFLATETLCIYAGSLDISEDIGVYEWDGTQWQFLGNLTETSGWNNFTVSYLISTNYTIKFQGWNETSDSEQSSWQIDAILLRLEGAGQNESVVDNDTSDVDSAADVGTLTDFSNMTALDGNVASLTEVVNGGSLDCTGGYMIIGDGSVDWSSTAGTISFWMKLDTVSGRPYGQDPNMELRFSGSNIILDWGSDITMTTATTFSVDTWYFIAVVWDETSNDLLVYIGDDVTTPTLDANSQQGTWFWSLPFFDETNYFMRGLGGSGLGDPVDGHGQDLRYFNTARSQAAIQSDYKQQLTGSEPNLVNYYKLTEDFADSADTDDGSGSGSFSFVTDDFAPLISKENWGITADTFTLFSTATPYRYMGGISPNIEGMTVTRLWIRCGSSGTVTIALYTGGSLDDPTDAIKRTEAYNVPVSAGWNAIDVPDFSWSGNTVTWIGWAHDCSVYCSTSASDAEDFQSARGRWTQDSPSDADETSPMPSSPGSGSFGDFWYAVFAEYTLSDSYRMDHEVQWTGLPHQLPNEELCIYCGTLDDEDILVDVWNGTGWENLFLDLTANSWNNVSIAEYLNSPTLTIRFRDGNTTDDTTTQDSWEIDVALIHLWQEATVYKLDLEVQWTNADFDEYYEELCIKTGVIEAEDISVDAWDGSQWQEVISDLNPAAWNNVSVTQYLTSSIFTIRFRGGSDSSDLNQESWQIDAVLLHTWTPFDKEPPNILWGSNQFANGTGTNQVHIDIDAEDIYYGSGIDRVWYRIWNVTASEWVSGHNNVSITSPNFETNVNVSNWHPSNEYYVEAFANDTGGYENSTQSITGDEYRYFTIVHSISVSTPAVSYSGGAIQELDITGVTATCSYAVHGELDYTTATVHNYMIYTSEGSPTGISGDLLWTGGFWQALDVNVSSLSDGDYYVQCTFEDSDATGTSHASNIFTKTTDTGGDGGGGDGNGGGNGGNGGDNGGGGTNLQIMILSIDYPSQIEKYSNVQIEIILTSGEGILVSGAIITLTIDNGSAPLYLAVDEEEGSYTAMLSTDILERGNHSLIVTAQKSGFEALVSSVFAFEIIVSYPLLTIIQHPSYAPQVIEEPIQLLIDPTFYILISLIFVSVMIQKITFAPISSRKLRALYIFTTDGKCFYARTFTVGGVESHLMTAALSGIISLIMEATSSDTPTRTVDQGNFDIMLEYGRSFIIATFVEKRTFNTRKIRKGQQELVKKIEEKYGMILAKWDGNLRYFQELDHLILDAFDFKVTQDLILWIKEAAKVHEELVAYYANHRQYQMVGRSLWKAYDLYKKIKSPDVPKILARWIAFGKALILSYIMPKTIVRNKILSIIFRFLDFVRTPFLLKTFQRIQSTLNPETLKKIVFFQLI